VAPRLGRGRQAALPILFAPQFNGDTAPQTLRCIASFDNLIILILSIDNIYNRFILMAKRPSFTLRQNRLKQLRAFCHAAQSASISKAAEQMFLSQPAVSLLIKELEKDMGMPLFHRYGPRISLTDEGKVLLELTLPLIEGLESIPDNFNERCSNLVSGSLHIAAGESAILYILPELIRDFRETYPGIQVKLSNVTVRESMDMLRMGTADFAIGSILEVPSDIIYIPTMTYDPVLIIPRGHELGRLETVTLEAISQYGLILSPRYLSTWRLVEVIFQQHNLEYSVALEAGGWEVIKRYVELGLGISIVNSICLTGREDLDVIPLEKYFPKRHYGMLLRQGRFLSPATRRFIEMIDGKALEKVTEANTTAYEQQA